MLVRLEKTKIINFAATHLADSIRSMVGSDCVTPRSHLDLLTQLRVIGKERAQRFHRRKTD